MQRHVEVLSNVEVGAGDEVERTAGVIELELLPQIYAALDPVLQISYVTLFVLGILVNVTDRLAVPGESNADCIARKLLAVMGCESMLASLGGVLIKFSFNILLLPTNHYWKTHQSY